MSSWNRPPDPHASVFSPSASSGGSSSLARSPWIEPEQVPSWLRPFTLDANTRFTRTPDVFLRRKGELQSSAAALAPLAAAEPVPVAPAPDLLPEPQAQAAPEPESLGDWTLPEAPSFPAAALTADLDDDDVLIDWTGESWAARLAAERGAQAPAAQNMAPADPQCGAALAPAPNEPMVLRRRLAEALAADAAREGTAAALPAAEDPAPLPERCTIEAALAPAAADAGEVAPSLSAPESPAAASAEPTLAGTPLNAPETQTDAAPSEQSTPLPDAAAAETDQTVAISEEALSIAPTAHPSMDDLPASILRLGRLIVLHPVVPAPACEQDLRAPEPEPEVASAGDAAAPTVTFSAIPVPPLGAAGTFTATFGWPLFATASLAPAAAPEADAAPVADRTVPAEGAEAGAVEMAQEERIASAAEEATEAATVEANAPLPVVETLACEPDAQALPTPEPDAPAAPPVLPSLPAPALPVLPLVAASGLMHEGYELPALDLLSEPPPVEPALELSEEALDRNSAALQQTLRDFGVRGEVIDANPGPVVTLYEFEPAPGTKSSRVIGLSADIARSMSAVSARVAVVEGRNVIGIELPNQRRETVWLRELLAAHAFTDARARLGLCLGKTIGGEPVIVDLARMPHLLVAGTTGSGKSVAINTMILSLLYRLTPEQCRLIMIDPKMLELSVYEGIPHLLTPVVTDPKKAIIALQWAVREMEDRYRKMSRLKVRNIEGFNARVAEARAKGEVITSVVQTGFDKETGEMTYEEVTMDLASLPYIVIIVDEMADLMMVAGKDIEGAIQRLAQMARAAGIHLVMATQRPSVDVITGTIKANFPTRISFQVTSKIDSRTILGEMGAETLLGQGDMLYMANGGRITRVHGPFVSDAEVEHVVAHLKAQGRPEYLEAVTSDEVDEEEEVEDVAVFDKSPLAEDGSDHYEQAVAIVLRDRKASTSYIQRRLQIGYNKAASLMERMENEGIVGPANHAGKREILSGRPS
ncbi:DNA translocase FtsK [Aquabacter sp. L1I39]|uniref:DNA translocase FtsK n=1 Tax=Aquabacter sp. L1I39 TaxID=2820278 RepID=UPI001ADA1811|nr:DNA translocase FtsK [Aquabacter sp. L1I39]QTL03906.1 DNA translocase FtsK [Aquabacter sp. L1I39]